MPGETNVWRGQSTTHPKIKKGKPRELKTRRTAGVPVVAALAVGDPTTRANPTIKESPTTRAAPVVQVVAVATTTQAAAVDHRRIKANWKIKARRTSSVRSTQHF